MQNSAEPRRVLAIDYGQRRVGLAISDPYRVIAQPLPVLRRRRGKRPPTAAVARVADQYNAGCIVIGLPLTSEGDENEWTLEVRAFGSKLHQRTGLPVHYVDERLTSARARRTIQALGLKRTERQRKERVDTAAAMLILQAFLDDKDDTPTT